MQPRGQPDYAEGLRRRRRRSTRSYFDIYQNPDSMVQDYKAGNLDAILDCPASYSGGSRREPGTTTVGGAGHRLPRARLQLLDSPKSKGNPLLLDVPSARPCTGPSTRRRSSHVAMAGLAEPGTSLLSPVQRHWHWERAGRPAQSPYDPEKAKQILDDAGYIDRDGDGVREDAKGNKLDFRLAPLTEYPEDGDGRQDDRTSGSRTSASRPRIDCDGRGRLRRRHLRQRRLSTSTSGAGAATSTPASCSRCSPPSRS